MNHKLITEWGKNIDINKPHQEYPRPQLTRNNWMNLNGIWNYKVEKRKDNLGSPLLNHEHINWSIPSDINKDIVVPFSPETILSGVKENIKPDDVLWYEKSISLSEKTGLKTILHFGAVDQISTVFINGKQVYSFAGGYFPFSIDISDEIVDGDNVINVAVTDDSNNEIHAYGKQNNERGEIWYTPQSGIWQTVWLEQIPTVSIESIKITPDYDAAKVCVELFISDDSEVDKTVTVLKDGEVVESMTQTSSIFNIDMHDFIAWSPDNPFLYDLNIEVGDDQCSSYFGMRKFSMKKDNNGHMRALLNNEPIFQNGLLDQGYWSDGMYTPPSDDAMIWEINKVKELGFNMLRKHIKIEPLRWYYHCDRLGMLVWQDLITGGKKYNELIIRVLPFLGIHLDDTRHRVFGRLNSDGRQQFEVDMKRTVDLLYNTVSLSCWVPFNEGWGQFDSKRLEPIFRALDNTRLIDMVSGWHDQGGGDFNSPHIYYKKFKMKPDKHSRIQIVSEFGGYSSPTKDHMSSDELFGYQMYETHDDLWTAYETLYEDEIIPKIKDGLSASVYTQVSDIEDEINGLFTYDRAVVKLNVDDAQSINDKVYETFDKVVRIK